MPVTRSVRDATTIGTPVRRARSRGSSSSASIPRISRGTPGSIATHRPRSFSSQIPGADPWRLVRMVAPSGITACCRFDTGNGPGHPREAHSASSWSTTDSSRRIARPKSAAIDGLVRSSDVGPSPPVVITPSARSSASPTTAAMATASSPTDVRRAMVIPTAASSRARCAPFVSIVNPSSSSSPIVTSSTFIRERARRSAGDRAPASTGSARPRSTS